VSRGRFDPLAAFIDAGESADGTKKSGGGRRVDVIDVFQDFLDDHAKIFAAADVESRSATVTVEGGPAVYAVLLCDLGGAVPIDEIVFNVFEWLHPITNRLN
jgi:hypothetical protein